MTGPGPTVVVTGAAGGIGRAVGERLLRDGCRAALLDIEFGDRRVGTGPDSAQTNSARAFEVDVTDRDQVERAVGEIEDDLGPIEGLVNCAGTLHHALIADLGVDDWNHTLAINASGVLNMCAVVAPRMAHRGRGSIVTITSNAAHTPRVGLAAYAASKAAASMITRCVGLEVADRGVRCNCVAPGSTDTPMLTALAGDDAKAASVRGTPSEFRLGIPLQKIAHPEDIASTVAFLLSDEANHITLETFTIDGGATLGAR